MEGRDGGVEGVRLKSAWHFSLHSRLLTFFSSQAIFSLVFPPASSFLKRKSLPTPPPSHTLHKRTDTTHHPTAAGLPQDASLSALGANGTMSWLPANVSLACAMLPNSELPQYFLQVRHLIP